MSKCPCKECIAYVMCINKKVIICKKLFDYIAGSSTHPPEGSNWSKAQSTLNRLIMWTEHKYQVKLGDKIR